MLNTKDCNEQDNIQTNLMQNNNNNKCTFV